MTDLTAISDIAINAIKETEEYINYQTALARLKENDELFSRTNEMRDKNYRLHLSNSDDMVDLIDALTNEYDDVINNELVSDFLNAEASLCKLVRVLDISVVKGLEFE